MGLNCTASHRVKQITAMQIKNLRLESANNKGWETDVHAVPAVEQSGKIGLPPFITPLSYFSYCDHIDLCLWQRRSRIKKEKVTQAVKATPHINSGATQVPDKTPDGLIIVLECICYGQVWQSRTTVSIRLGPIVNLSICPSSVNSNY
jgi:hypothetical protein